MREHVIGAVLGVVILLGGLVAPAAAQGGNRGVILSLVGVGASRPGDPIDVSSSVQALDPISQSNLYYLLRAPSGAVVAQQTTDPGGLSAGQVFNDAWSTSNTPQTGTYTVSLCWSTGNSHNCNIAYAETSFYSVPTLGIPLSLVALGLLAAWLWRRRPQFAPKST